jgi:hypothetical protein
LGGTGADYLIEIGGPMNMVELTVAAGIHGIITVVGTRGRGKNEGNAAVHTDSANFRRIKLKNKLQLEENIKAI